MHQSASQYPTWERAIRIRDVCNRIGISRTHLYRMIAKGTFPCPTHISERISVWREADIDHWLAGKFSSAKSTSVGNDHG